MMMMLLLVLLLLIMMMIMMVDDDDEEEEEEPDGMTSRSQARPAIQGPAQTRGGCPIAALCSKATFRAAVTRLLQCLRLQSPRHERFSAPCRATAFFSHTRLHSTDAPSNRPRFGPEIAPALLRTCRLFFVMKELSLQSRALVVNSFPKPTPAETQTLLSRPQDPPYF